MLLDGIVKKQDKIPAQTLTHIRGLVKDLMAQETKAQRGPMRAILDLEAIVPA